MTRVYSPGMGWGWFQMTGTLCVNELDAAAKAVFTFEPHHEKTCLQGLRPGKIQTGLRSHRSYMYRLKISGIETRG